MKPTSSGAGGYSCKLTGIMPRFSRIALFLLLVVVAWYFGPILFSLLSLVAPSVVDTLVWFTPTLSGHTPSYWFEFILSIILIWIFFKIFTGMFGFMAPKAQQYGTTKSVRRIQGVIAELAIIGLFFGIFITGAAMSKPGGLIYVEPPPDPNWKNPFAPDPKAPQENWVNPFKDNSDAAPKGGK